MSKYCKFNYTFRRKKSVRLQGYDYSLSGAYYITLCCKDRAHLFGHVLNGEMIFNDAGIMINKWHMKLPEKFPDIVLGDFITMPNHFHAIIINKGIDVDLRKNPDLRMSSENIIRPDTRVGTDRSDELNSFFEQKTSVESNLSSKKIAPIDKYDFPTELDATVGSDPCVGPSPSCEPDEKDLGDHPGTSLFKVVQWFKTMSTNEYIRGVKNLNWPPFNKKVWQRSYYDHIIKSERAYDNISNYILNNPLKWHQDKFI